MPCRVCMYMYVHACMYVRVCVCVCSISELLVDIVEGLGAHSIHIGELKQLIGSLRTLEDGKLVRFHGGLHSGSLFVTGFCYLSA